MPEFICEECGRREFHENEDTLKMMVKIHENFCRKERVRISALCTVMTNITTPWMLKGQMTKRMYLFSS